VKTIHKEQFAPGVAEARTRILMSAANAFATNGFRNSTVRDIAISANVNDVTVYRYFPSKQQLYWAALDQRLRNSDLPSRITELLLAAKTPEQLLRDISATVLEAFGADPMLPRLINFTLLELEEERRLMYQLHFRSQYLLLVERMSDWISSGAMRAVDPSKAALSLVGILLAECHLKTDTHPKILNPETTGVRAAEYADICIAGLIPQK
jgi:AcrR family transcriptional regulator